MDQSLQNQLILNAIIVGLMQHLKNSKWFPWLHAESEKLNRWVAIILAGLASLGVHSNFDRASGVLTITGLTTATIVPGIYNWIVSFISQQVIFKATTNPANSSYAVEINGAKPVEVDVKQEQK